MKYLLLSFPIAFAAARLLSRVSSYAVAPAFFIILVIELSLYFVYTLYLYPFCFSPLRNIPGPKDPHILFGHGKEEVGNLNGLIQAEWTNSLEDPNPDFLRYLGFFREEKLVPTSANSLRQLLTDETFVLPDWFRRGVSIFLGDGLIMAEGERHHRLRKLLAPAFTPSQIRHFTPLFWDKSKELTFHIRNQILASGRKELEINMLNWTDRVTLDMIGLSAFGTDFEGLRDPEQGLYSLYDNLYPMDGFSAPLDVLCVYVLPMFLAPAIVRRLPLKPLKDQRQNSQLLREFCLSLIVKQQNVKDLEVEEGNHKRKYSYLLSVIVSGNKLTEEEMVENMVTIIGAGYATNAAALCWAMYNIAQHPEVQARLRAEIRSVLGSSSTPVTAANMDAMKYLHCVVMENTRLYPSVPGTWREATETRVIAGQTIPKGTQIIISSFQINRSKAFWGPDAEEFVPERWEPARRQKGVEHCGGYMTYSVGHKACVGKEYSLRAMKAVLIALVGDFRFSYEGEDPMKSLVAGITLRPKGGLRLKVEMAEPW